MTTVHLTQYVRPDGHPRDVYVDLPDDIAAKAKGMSLSCEVLIDGQVMLYARWAKEDEEAEINEEADNGPGNRSPGKMTAALIERLWTIRDSQESLIPDFPSD